MGIQASPCCRLTMMVGIHVLILLGHLMIETEAWSCSRFDLKPESAAMDYCEKMQKVIRKKDLDCDRNRETDPDDIVDCGAFFKPLNIYSSKLSKHVSCKIDDECDGIWKDIYHKVKVKKTELEVILEEHKEHLDVVRKLAKRVANLSNSSLLGGLKLQMFKLINFKDPEKGFTKVIEVIEKRLVEVEGEDKEEEGDEKPEGNEEEEEDKEEADEKEDEYEEEGSGLIVEDDDER